MAKKQSRDEMDEVLGVVNFIKDYMVENMMTKEDGATKVEMASGFLRVEERLLSIEQELKEIKRRLSTLEKEIGSIDSKYKKDIEDLWKHVIAIEKRLKMQRA